MPPKEAANNRKYLSLSGKLEVISYFNKTKCSIRKLATQFKISKTQAGEIVKKQDKYLELFNSEVDTASLRPESAGFLIDKYVYQWYEELKNENIPVSGPMIQNKALAIARELGNGEFKASNGWLERFRVRHKIISKSPAKRKRKPEKEAKCNFDEWKKQLDLILATYTAENIFSAVETGLFFRAIPEDTPHVITENCSNGELSDQRFTILFCISMAGQKEKPLVVAKPLKSKPDEGLDFSKYQVDCEFNSMAWLTRNIMIKWLKDFDNRMVDQKRNVVLFLSDTFFNCESQLRNIKIVYFPSCLPSENQTPNHGVIQNFKIIYRTLLLKRLIDLKENDEQDADSSQTIMSQAMGWVETAWKELSVCVIHRCFEEIGFTFLVPNTISDNEAFLNDVSNLLCAYDCDVNAVDYVSIDSDLITSALGGDEPELIEVLVDGNEMRDILMQEEEMDEDSKHESLSSEDLKAEFEKISPSKVSSKGLRTNSKDSLSITSYSEALHCLRDLEQFYLSQNDSKAALLVCQLIDHNKNAMNEQ